MVLYQAFTFFEQAALRRIHQLLVSTKVCLLLHKDMVIMHQLGPNLSCFFPWPHMKLFFVREKSEFLKPIYGEKVC